MVFNEDSLINLKPPFRILDNLNVYKINLYQHLNLMYRRRSRNIPAIFNDIKNSRAQIPNKKFRA